MNQDVGWRYWALNSSLCWGRSHSSWTKPPQRCIGTWTDPLQTLSHAKGLCDWTGEEWGSCEMLLPGKVWRTSWRCWQTAGKDYVGIA